MWIAGFALFVLGLVFIITAPINKKKNARCSEQAPGMLIKIRRRSRSTNMYYYSYRVNGTEYQTKSTIRSKEANAVGDQCTIWYNPKKPKEAQPFKYTSSKIYTILLVIGIVMALSGVILTGLGSASKNTDAKTHMETSDISNPPAHPASDVDNGSSNETTIDIAGRWNTTICSIYADGETKNSDDLPVFEFDETGGVLFSAPSGVTDTGTWTYKDEEITIVFTDGTQLHGTINSNNTMAISGVSGENAVSMVLEKQ